ncbi:uncharacterized protein LOC124136739 isoform X2 [Haliotis rufescens]|uniref:uncharacterized protein LOC124136739 isoform X2 n=1 Tax=Haliotis rufescens TaxID=6454 RepID=UPI00201F2129|nr:uncharacterized protein LOC124136739 isoform X2 [Haliotis rufescens]
MASVFISPVKPGSFVLLVLILMNPSHTHSTTSNTTTDNLTFESSCVALNWSAAVTNCIDNDAEIFSVEDLITSIGSNVLKNATAEHTKIWININDTCWTSFNGSFEGANCSDSNYYVCTSNTSTSSDWYVPCRNETTDASTQGSTTSTPQIQTTTQGSNTKVLIIASVVCVIVALVAVVIISGCYIIKRNKKPIKYAVRTESVMYHRQHPDPGIVEEPQLADVQLVCPTEADGGNSGMSERQDGEYDILCRPVGNGGKVVPSDSTAVYSHLCASNAAAGPQEENNYDTTTLPQYDRRPVDRIYDRIHVPDN